MQTTIHKVRKILTIVTLFLALSAELLFPNGGSLRGTRNESGALPTSLKHNVKGHFWHLCGSRAGSSISPFSESNGSACHQRSRSSATGHGQDMVWPGHDQVIVMSCERRSMKHEQLITGQAIGSIHSLRSGAMA